MDGPYQGSPAAYDCVRRAGVWIPMRDGTRLATDLYLPARRHEPIAGPFPVLLERTPYGRANVEHVVNGRYFARRGYGVANQDVRGRFDSEGEWTPLVNEASDGVDTIAWLAVQDFCDGRVATMGGSYNAMAQSAAAALNPPALAAMVLAVGGSNLRDSSLRHHGAFELRFLLYALSMAATSPAAQADDDLRQRLEQACQRAPGELGRRPWRQIAEVLAPLESYHRWVIDVMTRGDGDDYWRQPVYALDAYYRAMADVPTLFIGGWYDSYAGGTCENFAALRRCKSSPQALLMGPWTHGGWGNSIGGEVDFGGQAIIDYNEVRLAWFDRHLKGLRSEAVDWPAARIFVMGAGADKDRFALSATPPHPWVLCRGGAGRDEADFPPPDAADTAFHLQPGGGLATDAPPADGSPSRFRFDPRRPVPSIGGNVSGGGPAFRGGAFDQRERPDWVGCRSDQPLADRDDVLCFVSEPLEQDLEVVGVVRVTLFVATWAADTDFTAKLIDQSPPGAGRPTPLAINVVDSIFRLGSRRRLGQGEPATPGQVVRLDFVLSPTATVFGAGHRIRLDVSSSNFPRFDVNPNTGGAPGGDGEPVVAEQTVYHDAARPSHVVLPVLRRV